MKPRYAFRLAPPLLAAALAFSPLHATHAQGEILMPVKTKTDENSIAVFNNEVLAKLDDFSFRATDENWNKGAGIPKDVFGELNRIHNDWVQSGKLAKLPKETQTAYNDYMKTLLEFADAGQKVALNLTPVRAGGSGAARVSYSVQKPRLPPFLDTSGQITTEPIKFRSGSLIGSRLSSEQEQRELDRLEGEFLNAHLTGKGTKRAGEALADFIENKGLASSLGVPPSQSREILADLRKGELRSDIDNQLSTELASKLTELVRTLRVRIPSAVIQVSVDVKEIPLARITPGQLVLRAGALLSIVAYDNANPQVKGDLENGYDIFLDIKNGDLGVQAQGKIGAGLKLTEEHTAYVDLLFEHTPLKGNSPAQFTVKIGFTDEKGLKIGPLLVYSDTYATFSGHIRGRAPFEDTLEASAGTSLSFPIVRIKGMPTSLLAAVEGDPIRDSTSLAPDLRAKLGTSIEPSDNLTLKLYGIGSVAVAGGKLRQNTSIGAGTSFGILSPDVLGLKDTTFEGGLEWTNAVYRLELFDQTAKTAVSSIVVFMRGTF